MMHSLEDGKVLCQECFGGTLSRARASILMKDKKPLSAVLDNLFNTSIV
jgi:hypothetical protein